MWLYLDPARIINEPWFILQLGIIMSHEIAHTILGHAGELLSYLNFLNAILIVPLVNSFKPIIIFFVRQFWE
jgi:hypothetical protein